MSDALKLAMRISAVDLFSGVLRRFHREVAGSGKAAQAAQRDYDRMIRHTSAGLKALAVSAYGVHKIAPAVKYAANLQTSLLSVQQVLAKSHDNTKAMADKMARVRANSIEVASHMKYSAVEITDVTRELLQGGVNLDAILGKRGAAFSVEALAEVSHADPASVAENISKVGSAFNLGNKQYGQAANTIYKTAMTSPGDLGEFLYNLRQIGPAAHNLRIPLKDATTALGAVSSLGMRAGFSLRGFFRGLKAATSEQRRALAELHVQVYDKHGHFVGFEEALKRLRKGLAPLNEHQQQVALQKIFQQGGVSSAMLLLNDNGYERALRRANEHAGLSKAMHIWEQGVEAKYSELLTTTQTTLATTFQPLIAPLSAVAHGLNTLSGDLGKFATKHPAFAKGVSYTAAGGIGIAGLYGAYRLAKGGRAGLSFLRRMKGLKGTAVGIAEGKAVQAATGVAPVFVTNWPANLGAGTAVAAAENSAGKQAAAGGIGATLRSMLGYALPVTAGAGGAYVFYKQGHHYGHAVKSAQDNWDASEWKKGGRYDALQPKGEKRHLSAAEVAARLALEKKLPYGTWYEKHSDAYHWWENSRPINDWKRMIAARTGQQLARQKVDVGGTLQIEINDKGRARVTQARLNVPDVNISVGHIMEVP